MKSLNQCRTVSAGNGLKNSFPNTLWTFIAIFWAYSTRKWKPAKGKPKVRLFVELVQHSLQTAEFEVCVFALGVF